MKRLRTVLVCAALQLAVFQGAPMRPEEIRELMQTMNKPKVVRALPSEDEDGSLVPDRDAGSTGARIDDCRAAARVGQDAGGRAV